MAEPKDKKKRYEPPVIREIGGVFEQAMGVSTCANGGGFISGPCNAGQTPTGSCSGGSLDQACFGGSGDSSGCSRGILVSGGGCSNGIGG